MFNPFIPKGLVVRGKMAEVSISLLNRRDKKGFGGNFYEPRTCYR